MDNVKQRIKEIKESLKYNLTEEELCMRMYLQGAIDYSDVMAKKGDK